MDFGDLGDALGGLRNTLGGLGDALGGLGGKALQAATGFDAATGRFRNAQGQFQTAGSALEGVAAGGLTKVAGALNSVVPAINSAGAAIIGLATGPIPTTEQAFASLGQTLGGAITGAADMAAQALSKLGPVGEAAGAAIQALGAVAGATVGQLVAIAGVAVDVVQKLDLMRDRFAAFTGSQAAAGRLQASLEGLNLPFAKSQVEGWALALEKSGVAADQVADRVKAIAAAEALGPGGGAAAEALFKRLGQGGAAADSFMKDLEKGGRRSTNMLKEMGVTMADLGGQTAVAKMNAEQLQNAISKALQKKGKGPLDDMALSLPVILQKAQEGIRSLFDGLGGPVKSLMTEVKNLFSEFNKGGGVINGLKPTVTSVMTAVINGLRAGVIAVHELIQGFMGTAKAKTPMTEIGAEIRKIVDVAGRMISAFEKLDKGKPSSLSSGLTALSFILEGVAEILTDLMNNATAAMMILDNMGAIADAAGSALSGLASGAMDAASNFVAGLVDGISAGAGAVVDAVKGLASSALGAFTGALGIHSPSTIMLEHGEDNIAGAAAMGVEAGTPRVAKAMAKMGDAEPGTPKGGARGGSGGGGNVYHVSYAGPVEDYPTFRKNWDRLMEELELEAGSAQEATT